MQSKLVMQASKARLQTSELQTYQRNANAEFNAKWPFQAVFWSQWIEWKGDKGLITVAGVLLFYYFVRHIS